MNLCFLCACFSRARVRACVCVCVCVCVAFVVVSICIAPSVLSLVWGISSYPLFFRWSTPR